MADLYADRGECFICGCVFTFNPAEVPRRVLKREPLVKGEPICKACMVEGNAKRELLGLDPLPIHPEAYEPEERI